MRLTPVPFAPFAEAHDTEPCAAPPPPSAELVAIASLREEILTAIGTLATKASLRALAHTVSEHLSLAQADRERLAALERAAE